MKVTPLAQGTGVPSQVSGAEGTSPSRLERARSIASGQFAETPEPSGDAQVDRLQANVRRIKMKTQVSTNRQDPVVEEAVTETPVETQSATPDQGEPAKESEDTRLISPQFAALARQKRALQVKESELAKREEALKATPPAGDEALKAELKANPLKIFDLGVTYDQLTEAILANQNGISPEINALKAELKALKEELNGQFTTRDTQAEKQVLSEIMKEAQSLTAQGEEYEAIRQAKAQNTVVDLIHRTWKQTGEVLDTQEAANLVENQLIEEALPFAKIKKVQSRLTPAQEVQAAQIPVPRPNTKVMRTLTNRDSASPVMDKRARAIAAMNGTLKKG